MHFERTCILLFLSHFGIETANTYTFLSPLGRSKTIADSKPKWANYTPFGITQSHMAVYKGVPPPRQTVYIVACNKLINLLILFNSIA